MVSLKDWYESLPKWQQAALSPPIVVGMVFVIGGSIAVALFGGIVAGLWIGGNVNTFLGWLVFIVWYWVVISLAVWSKIDD